MNASIDPMQCIGLPICTVNEFGRLVYWNEGAAKLFGRPADDVIGCEWHSVIRTVSRSKCCPLCDARTSLRRQELLNPVEVTLSLDGCHQPATMVPMPMTDGSREPMAVSFIILTRDVLAAGKAVHEASTGELHLNVYGDQRPVDELTVREREILACVVEGLDARAIGSQLGVSHATARTYVQRLLTKLGVRSKAEAVKIARTYNLIEAGNPALQSA